MSKESIHRRIEGFKRDIERQKAIQSSYREDISKIRIRKSREAVRYSTRMKNTSSTASRHTIRSQKKREWESFARQIDREKEKIQNSKDKVNDYKVQIKRCRDQIKRLK